MRLSDCFIELIAYVAYFAVTAGKRQPPYERVRADIERLLSDIKNRCDPAQVPPEELESGLFAVAAWVDETILNSEWEHRGRWQRELLQRQLFNTTEAGEKFFERLNAVEAHQRDLREVYYLCLAMGFKGRYCNPGDELLIDQLKTSNLKLLTGSSMGLPSIERGDLFPEAYPVDRAGSPVEEGSAGRFSKFMLLGLSFPVILFAGLYLVYSFILNSVGESLLN